MAKCQEAKKGGKTAAAVNLKEDRHFWCSLNHTLEGAHKQSTTPLPRCLLRMNSNICPFQHTWLELFEPFLKIFPGDENASHF